MMAGPGPRSVRMNGRAVIASASLERSAEQPGRAGAGSCRPVRQLVLSATSGMVAAGIWIATTPPLSAQALTPEPGAWLTLSYADLQHESAAIVVRLAGNSES